MTVLSISDFFHSFLNDSKSVFNPAEIIRYGGMALLFLTVYAQNGLFFCFFLPGDALLFTAGVFVATGKFDQPIVLVCMLLTVAAFLGNLTGYAFGIKSGPLLFKRKDSVFFRHEHLHAADLFFQKYGGIAITVCFFLPIIRTFTPIVAGVIRHPFGKFISFSFLGAALWVNVLVLAGYFLGGFPFVEKNLKYFILGMIVGITSPVIIKIVRESARLRAK